VIQFKFATIVSGERGLEKNLNTLWDLRSSKQSYHDPGAHKACPTPVVIGIPGLMSGVMLSAKIYGVSRG
jgi:hypothetical protein